MRNIAVAATAAMLVLVSSADATTYRTVHRFTGSPDGEWPLSGLVQDALGNLYGTTQFGGVLGIVGRGTVYKITPDGTETVLHAFEGGPDDGDDPRAALTLDDDGNLYGTTTFGGGIDDCNLQGCGTVFKIASDGTETVLHKFQDNGVDGIQLMGGVVRDASGNLFGTAQIGGAHSRGTVYKIAPDGTFTVVHAFLGQENGDAGAPNSLIADRHGNLYGTAAPWPGQADCATLCGTVFKITNTGVESILHAFTGGADGAQPFGNMAFDRDGNLFGTTTVGGAGFGTVFKIAADGTFSTLYSFTGGADGDGPSGSLAIDKNANLYGTTERGGGTCFNGRGCGTVFEIAQDGTHTVLHAFKRSEGYLPQSGVMKDRHGNLYGAVGLTYHGPSAYGGAVFKLHP